MPKLPLTSNGALNLHRNASPANTFAKVALQVRMNALQSGRQSSSPIIAPSISD